MEVGGKSICFLDLKIRIINGQLETTIYRKSTDFHLYVHAKSCYKPFSVRGSRRVKLYVYNILAVQIMSIDLNQ